MDKADVRLVWPQLPPIFCPYKAPKWAGKRASKKRNESMCAKPLARTSPLATPVGPLDRVLIQLSREIITGENDQFGELCRDLRLSQPESQSSATEEEWLNTSMDAKSSYGLSPTLQAMQADGIWDHPNASEQAERNSQRRTDGSGTPSSSPRSPNTRGYVSFQSRRNRGRQQDGGHPVTTVKASGTPHHQHSRGWNRTSSESEQVGRGSRGPARRKRGLSETESRLIWDKYGICRTGNGRAMMCVFGFFNHHDDFF